MLFGAVIGLGSATALIALPRIRALAGGSGSVIAAQTAQGVDTQVIVTLVIMAVFKTAFAEELLFRGLIGLGGARLREPRHLSRAAFDLWGARMTPEGIMELRYVIKFVENMEWATAFHTGMLGLKLKFQSPFWTELDTGSTILALHPATPAHPAGTLQLGYGTEDLAALYANRDALGLTFSQPPAEQHGRLIASFLDSENMACRISGAAR